MSSQSTSFSSQARYPKPGTGFLLVRLIGWGFKIVGWLFSVAAIIGFIVILVKMGPTLVGAFQFPEQKMAGLIISTLLGGLLVFVILGVAGLVLVGIGIAFNRWGTTLANS